MLLSRRTFVFGAAASSAAMLLAGCSQDRTVTATPTDFLGEDRQPGDPLYSRDAQAFIAAFPADLLVIARKVYSPELLATCTSGVVALYERCPYDRILVSYCPISQSYQCRVCGSQFNRLGETMGGPTPRGLDHVAVSLDDAGEVALNRSKRVNGPPTGVHALLRESTVPDELGTCRNPTG